MKTRYSDFSRQVNPSYLPDKNQIFRNDDSLNFTCMTNLRFPMFGRTYVLQLKSDTYKKQRVEVHF